MGQLLVVPSATPGTTRLLRQVGRPRGRWWELGQGPTGERLWKTSRKLMQVFGGWLRADIGLETESQPELHVPGLLAPLGECQNRGESCSWLPWLCQETLHRWGLCCDGSPLTGLVLSWRQLKHQAF